MAFNYNKLKGRIVEKYGNQSRFAEFMDVAKQTINAKLSGNVELTKKDIVTWSKALEISKDEIGTYFFEEKV